MSRSLHTAAELANAGESQAEDSQAAFDKLWQHEAWAAGIVPSSSPLQPPSALKSALSAVANHYSQNLEDRLFHENESQALESQALEPPLIYYHDKAEEEARVNEKKNSAIDEQPREKNTAQPPRSILHQVKLPPGWTIRPNSAGKPRFFDQNGKLVNEAKMSSSSGSTTQENPPYLYEDHLATTDEEPSQTSIRESSTTASGLAHTLREDDTGHINLMKDFLSQDQAVYDDDEEAETQIRANDAAYDDEEAETQINDAADDDGEAETQIEFPQTPAITNPFKQSFHNTSALPPREIFGTTQTSPFLHAPTSAVRPSPDVYSTENITSPEKKTLQSSPSVRNLSFKGRTLPPNRQPIEHYVSRQEEEDIRNAMVVDYSGESQSSDGLDMDSQEIRRQAADKARREAVQQLSLVSAPARSTNWGKTVQNKKPAPEEPVAVVADEDEETEDDEEEDIPATSIAVPGSTEASGAAGGRRRSYAEEYIAQTNGTDARDTQTDDVVVDSQELPGTGNTAQDELPELDDDTENAPSHLNQSSSVKSAHIPDPLSEVSVNAPRTPKSPKSSKVSVIPGTSPVQSRMRPFSEIDAASPLGDSQVSMTGIGFTQDEEFQTLVYESSIPVPKSQPTPAAPAFSGANLHGLGTENTHVAASSPPAPITEVGGTPGGAAPVDIPNESSGPMVLDTPQGSNNASKTTGDVPSTAEEAVAAFAGPGALSQSSGLDPLTSNKKVTAPLNRKRGPPEPRVVKKSKTATSATAQTTVIPSEPSLAKQNTDAQSTTADTGLKYSTAPEAPASSTANAFSVQSSALSEISSVTTPVAFQDIDREPSVTNAESVAHELEPDIPKAESVDEIDNALPNGQDPEPDVSNADYEEEEEEEAAETVVAKGPVKSLKRKRATDTPTSSLAPSTKKLKVPAKAKKPVGRPKTTGKAMATPKAVKALRGLPASGIRSSARQAAGSVPGPSEKATPKAGRPRASTSGPTRSSSRLSIAPSEVGSLPSTPVRSKNTTKKTNNDQAATSGLFYNMAFAVSYVNCLGEKEDVLYKIAEEGGMILEKGFEELFAVDELPVTPSRRRASLNTNEILKDLENIKPNTEAENITFACVIADEPSRKAKYMQALALDIPCLHGNWIVRCVQQGRIVDWAPYLLCSGESGLLNGAQHNRFLTPYPAESANFSKHFESEGRIKLLQGKKILVVVGTTKPIVDKRKAYVFVIHAQGAEKVGTVPSIEAAKTILETDVGREKWDWVYVDKNEDMGQKALSDTPRRDNRALAKKPTKKNKAEAVEAAAKKSNKRKRQNATGDAEVADAAEDDAADEEIEAERTYENMPKVVGDKFIIESLIIGRLIHTHTPRSIAQANGTEAAAAAENGAANDGNGGVDEDEDELS